MVGGLPSSPAFDTGRPGAEARRRRGGGRGREHVVEVAIFVLGSAPATSGGEDDPVSWVDVLVVLLALVAGICGWRHGVAVAFLSFVGVIGGAILGVQLAPLLAANLEAKNTQVVVSIIVVVVVLVALGEAPGVYFGRRIRDRISGERTLAVDSALGSVLQAATVVVAAWLVALPLATASVPGLASACATPRCCAPSTR